MRDFSKYRKQYSQLWYIDQLNTHVKGNVMFEENNTKMVIWFLYGRYPRALGLDTKKGPKYTVKVKVVKVGKENWEIGWVLDSGFDEKDISSPELDGWERFLGSTIASLSCNELITNDWVDFRDRVVLRFEIYFH